MSDKEEFRIVWNPRRMSGRPTIGDSRLPADSVASRVMAGESVQSVAEDYQISEEQVRLACWWLVKHDSERKRWKALARKSWATWAAEWSDYVWWGTLATLVHPGDPPEVQT